jgi:hypothetical protein
MVLAGRSARSKSPRAASTLLALMQVYQQLWIRQSEARAEAVHRGLRAPLTP